MQSEKSLERVSKITGKPVKFYKADILDRDALNEIFDKEDIEYFRSKNMFSEDFLEYLVTLNLRGYIYAVPEELVFSLVNQL